MVVYKGLGDRLIGDRIVATYQDWQPKSSYRTADDDSNRNEMTLRKSVSCTIERPIRTL